MTRTLFAAIAATVLLLSAAVAPVAATPGDGQTPIDECQNAENAGGAQGPPGFVADLVPDFLSDLFADLPVPNFVKSAMGAPTCSSGS